MGDEVLMNVTIIIFATIGALVTIMAIIAGLAIWWMHLKDRKNEARSQELKEFLWLRMNSYAKEFLGVDKDIHNMLCDIRDEHFAEDVRIAYEKAKKAVESKSRTNRRTNHDN